jgi:cell division GTPase FtsZ
VVANFTGGKDLTLFDVGTALAHVQELSRPDADIVLGFNNDDRLGEKVQVILVITGLGAQSLEDAMSNPAEKLFNAPPPTPMKARIPPKQEPIPVGIPPAPVGSSVTADLDLPAFMRRNSRFANRE